MAATTDENATQSNNNTNDQLLVDMKLLLECLKFQKDCIPLQKQALGTLASMCQEKDLCRELFRTSGSLEYITRLVMTTTSHEVLQAGFYTLASSLENNVISQMRLSSIDTFNLLTKSLARESPVLLQFSAVFLAINLMYNNSQGQNNARESKLLHRLVDLFKCGIPITCASGHESDGDLWMNVVQALSVSCDNPQNELNQFVCCSSMPAAVSVLNMDDYPHHMIKCAMTVITACVSNNAKSQQQLNMVGGLKALGKIIQTLSNSELKNNSSLFLHTIRCACAAITGNDSNISLLSSFKIIPHILCAMKCYRDAESLLNIVLCLQTLTENNESNRQQLLDNEGVPLLVSVMASNTEDATLNKVISIMLQNCLIKDTVNPTQDVYDTMNNIRKLTDDGLSRLSQQPPILLENSPVSANLCQRARAIQQKQQQQQKSSRAAVVKASVNNVTEDDQSLQRLAATKLPVKDRVLNWLDQNISDTKEHHVRATSTKHTTTTTVPTSTQIHKELHTSVCDTTSRKDCYSVIESSFAESEMLQLKSYLASEQEKRMKLEKRLTKLEHKVTDKQKPQLSQSFCSVIPQSSSRFTKSNTPHKATKTCLPTQNCPPTHVIEDVHNFCVTEEVSNDNNIMSSASTCVACHEEGSVQLTSRTFIPHLSKAPGTCGYHRKIINSICCGSSSNPLTNGIAYKTCYQKQTQSLLPRRATLSPTSELQENTYSTITGEEPCTTTSNIINQPLISSPKQLHTDHSTMPHQSVLSLSPIELAPSREVPPQEIIRKNKVSKTGRRLISNSSTLTDCTKDCYDYPSTPTSTCCGDDNDESSMTNLSYKSHRRPNLPYTKSEEKYLIDGVKKVGYRWKHILSSYPFQHGRTATSLKDKYRLLKKKNQALL